MSGDVETGVGSGLLATVTDHTGRCTHVFVGIWAVLAIGAAAATMALEGSTFVYVAGGLSVIVAMLSFAQQKKLQAVKNMRETQEATAREVRRLTAENKKLEEGIEELTERVKGLEEIDEALTAITDEQTGSVERLKEQVEENKEILSKMRSNLKATLLQNIISVVLRTDDGNFDVDKKEMEELIVRIQDINGVTINAHRFKKKVGKNTDLNSVVEVIKESLTGDNLSEKDRIFTIPGDED